MIRPDGSHLDALISAAPLNSADGDLVGAVAGLLDITERKRVEEERDRLRQQEIEVRAQNEERRRIARDLHDVVLQDLSGVLQSLRLTYLRSKNAGLWLDLEEELEALGRASSGLRSAIYDLRQERESSFVESVESLVEVNRKLTPEREIALTIGDGFRGTFSPEIGVELLRILREVLTNVRRHSGARNVEVRLRAEREMVIAEVTDDGCGFDPAVARDGVGLMGMRERVEGLGGEIEVRSRPGEGTEVTVRVPSWYGTSGF
jgi:signal transduction histidine kinase